MPERQILRALHLHQPRHRALELEGTVVKVRLRGACAGCPGAAMTLKMGVERVVREAVPEITEVVAV